jgi:hypothetical protein
VKGFNTEDTETRRNTEDPAFLDRIDGIEGIRRMHEAALLYG